MSNLSVRYYDLNALSDPFIINEISQATIDQLDRGNVEVIANALYANTKICVNGIPYIKVNGIASIIRTGNSGLERALVYQGIPGLLPKSEVVSIDGYDHISGPSLAAILDARIATRSGKTRQYLTIALNLYRQILLAPGVRDLKEIFFEEINARRSDLKKERIGAFGIAHCEFTGARIEDFSKVEFSHIDSVVYNPSRALDITNGVIILGSIHADMTRQGIHTFEEVYQYCVSRNYSTAWAE
ncbi:hypothetical protein DPV79_34400 [Burkholderia reimsis]|uniref:Uncharacterized protein n=1 Tax=Burkholderia reimsis TaxID=2234132 RepID=A0A365QJY1_9BURK|nr:hypothetical protein [Burkholderia reimsis]RBB33555.1 hypothetical protein DPV79_34400 [Burkholderia reimsis]